MHVLPVLSTFSKNIISNANNNSIFTKGAGKSRKEKQAVKIPIKNPIHSDHVNDAVMMKRVAPLLMAAAAAAAALVALSPTASLAQTVDIQKGATLFGRACIGCHAAGGNIIQPGATLFANDLQRNGVESEEEIYKITYFGKGRMPGFGENCKPRGQCTFGPRLLDEEIRLLAQFVKSQADQGWPNLGTEQD